MVIRRVLNGLATYLPRRNRASTESGKGTMSARYCYSVWLRHLVMAHSSGLPVHPAVVAELGPGDSLGVGLAALLSGADKYFAFDVVRYAHNETNLVVLEELARLFRAREPIPGEEEYPKVEPRLKSYEFPRTILTDERLTAPLAEDRLRAIHRAVRGERVDEVEIRYFAPWYDLGTVTPASVDMILSQAVLEYVPDLPQAYGAFHRCLVPGGIASLVIDYKSHGTADAWDGHWTYSDLVWRLMRGNTAYGLNRETHSSHLAQLRVAGLALAGEVRTRRTPETPRERLAARFRQMSEDDRTTASAFIQIAKKAGESQGAGELGGRP
jgi:SAM-dependent methyltransferase